jgi:DinB superfamily
LGWACGVKHMSTFLEYTARILSYVEGKDPLEVQRKTPELLADLIVSAPEKQLYERPAPDKWSVAELLTHFADAEIVSTWRYRQIIEHDGCSLPGYDQELWHELGDYPTRTPEDSLLLFRLLRETNLQMFAKLTPEEWQRHGIHAERGRMTVADLARQIAGHDLNHLEQIRKILN